MKKQVLVIGGTYFAGRVFMVLASRTGEYDFHVVNRGRFALRLPGVTEYVCDRHAADKLALLLPARQWDSVIDFCAYEPGDTASLLAAVPGSIGQYIFISTCSVYDPGAASPKAETAPLLKDPGNDPGLVYAFKKLELEREAVPACAGRAAALTILRPAFIYGPLNYAPRESFYFTRILENRPIPAPVDATGRFSFIYVKDMSRLVMGCIGNPAAYGGTYNLSGPETVTYESFLEALIAAHGGPLSVEPVTVADVYARNIPVPFPLEGGEVFAGEAVSRLLDMEYIPFARGFKETYDTFMDVHRG